MCKSDFLAALETALQGLPQSDIDKSVEYYNEILDDQMEDGISEADAVTALGAPEEIAKQILLDTTLPKLMRAKVKPTRTLRGWEIALLILGSPIWASLLLAAASVLFSLYITIWAIIVCLYACNLTFALSSVICPIQGCVFIFTGHYAAAMFYFGATLACFGITVLTFLGFNNITVKLITHSKQLLLWIKSLFLKRRRTK